MSTDTSTSTTKLLGDAQIFSLALGRSTFPALASRALVGRRAGRKEAYLASVLKMLANHED